MKLRDMHLKTRLNLIAAIILLIGVGSSVLIYFAADNAADNALINDFEQSKRYRHDLELTGGKTIVLASELANWFEGLWHGESLAYTVAFISIGVSMMVFFVAHHVQSDPSSDLKDDGDPS